MAYLIRVSQSKYGDQYLTPAGTYTKNPMLFAKWFLSREEAFAYRKKFGYDGQVVSDRSISGGK